MDNIWTSNCSCKDIERFRCRTPSGTRWETGPLGRTETGEGSDGMGLPDSKTVGVLLPRSGTEWDVPEGFTGSSRGISGHRRD